MQWIRKLINESVIQDPEAHCPENNAGIAPDYETSFIRCGVKDYTIKIKPDMFHAWPVFTFLKVGRDGEKEIIQDIHTYFLRENQERNRKELLTG